MMRQKPHTRRGLMRVLVHILLFALLGVTCLVLGLRGRAMLAVQTEDMRIPTRAQAIHEKTEAYLKAALHSTTEDTAQQKNITNGFSTKRKSVKTAIDEKTAALEEDEAIVLSVIDTYMQGIASRMASSELLPALQEKAESEKAGIAAQVAREAEEAANAIDEKTVRKSMSVTATPHYTLMYYGTALWVVGAVLLALSVLLTILWFTKDEEGRARLGALLEPWDYLLPFLAGVGVFTLYPMVRVLIMSFQEKYSLGKNAVGTFNQWGLGNYEFVLFGIEGTTNVFMRGLRNTASYVLLTVPITAAIAILLAYLLNQKIHLNGLFQTAYFLPMVTTATAVGLVWRWMFNENFGLINALIQMVSPNAEKMNWLQSGNHAVSMAVLVIYGVWSNLPFTIILLLSGLQNIDDHLYTVAKVDGSGAARIFFRITVPLLSPTIGLVLIINSISAFKVYTDVVVLWNGSPQSYGMETVAWYIYDQLNISDGTHSLGYAAAAAMVLFVIIFIFTMIQKYIQRKWVYQ